MPKVLITFDEWQELEPVLMKHRIGYEVIFDDHNGTAEILLLFNTQRVQRHDNSRSAFLSH